MSVFNQLSIDYEYVKVRWQEPYVSAAVNRRAFGTVPKGIYGGFVIATSPVSPRHIRVQGGSVSGYGGLGSGLTGPGYVSGAFDETVGWHIAIHQTNQGYNTAVVIPPGVDATMDLDATGLDGQRVFVVLEVIYSPNAQSQAKLKLVNGAEIDANPSLIVVGYVDVPIVTPITSVNIGYNDPTYPRLTPLSTPIKAGLMPSSVWTKLDQIFPWQDLVQGERNPTNTYQVRITPSQKVVNNRRLYTYIQSNQFSKFPRDAGGNYNGGVNNDAYTLVDFQTGTIGGAHAIPGNTTFATPSIVSTPNQFQVALVSIDTVDQVQVQYGAAYGTSAAALAYANLPIASKKFFQVCAVLLQTDGSGVLQPIGVADVYDRRPFLNLGGGGGSDASELLERYKIALNGSTYGQMSPMTIALDGTTLIDGTSTGVLDAQNDAWAIDSGETLLTLQLLDDEMLSTGRDIPQLDLEVDWFLSNIDTAATYEVSRDGGVNWSTVSMSRIGATDAYRGTVAFTESAPSNLDAYAVGNADSSRELNATTQQYISQPVAISTTKVLNGVDLYMNKAGSPAGSFVVQICADSAGDPGAVLAQSVPVNLSSVSGGDSTVSVAFGNTVVVSGTYHVVVVPDPVYRASFVTSTTRLAWRTDASSPTISSARVWNGSAYSGLTSEAATFQLKGRLLDVRVRVTASGNSKKILGLAVYYDQVGMASYGTIEQQEFLIPAGAGTTHFDLNFIPNTRTLRVYEKDSGKVWVWPKFSVSGTAVDFPSGFFDSLAPIELLFTQADQGGAVDTKDLNSTAIAQNSAAIAALQPNVGENLSALRQYTLTVTGTNWTTARAIGVPYRTLDGAWRLRFNINGTLSVNSANLSLTVTGVTFKSGTGNGQAVSVFTQGGNPAIARAQAGNAIIQMISSVSEGGYSASGDVELDAKPTFVP